MNQQTQAAPLQTLQAPTVREANLPSVAPGFESLASFELMQRAARLLTSSNIVPANYRQYVEKKQGRETNLIENPNALANCVVALNMATRMKADPIMVMQNLYIVEGRPSWSSQWIIAAINGCGRFSPLRFDIKDLGEQDIEYSTLKWDDNAREKVPQKHKQRARNKVCIAWAIEKETGERIESPAVSIEMAIKEGWFNKNGSKWQTMDEVMLRYRAASFFGKLYAPEILMGLMTVEEAQDSVIDAMPDGSGGFTVDVSSLRQPPKRPQDMTLAEQWEKYDQVLADYGDKEAENFMPREPRPGTEQSAQVVEPAPGPKDSTAENPSAGTAAPESGAQTQTETGNTGTGSDTTQGGEGGKPEFTFNDAFNAVNKGDYELAEQIASHLSEGQRQQVEVAIKNRKNRPNTDGDGGAAAAASTARKPRSSGASLE